MSRRAPHPIVPRLVVSRLVVFGLAVLALVAAPVLAQDAEQEFGEEIQVTEVLLDARVTDSRGNLVLGLGAEDFVVEEDGEVMDLTGATFYSNRRFLESGAVAEAIGIDPEAVPTSRYFILFFHDQRRLLPRLTAQQITAGRDAAQWVQGDLLPNDHVAVMSYDFRLRPHLDFSTDRDELARVLRDAAAGYHPDASPSELANSDGPSLFTALPEGEALRDASVRIYDALELVGRAAAGVPGRKNMAFFSIGFGDVDELGFYRPDVRYYRPMMRQLNDGNVAIYPVDLITNTAFGGIRFRALESSLSHLASDTGGRYFFSFTNFMTPLQQMAEENNGHYLLSYRSSHPAGETGYQEVEVDTVNPELDVEARAGYIYGDGEVR